MNTMFNLPVNVGYMTPICKMYAEELNTVASSDELREFTKRWKHLWLLPVDKDWSPNKIEESIVQSDYDADAAFSCVTKNDKHNMCAHVENKEMCAGVSILMPPILALTSLVAKRYSVPDGTALIQLQRSFDNLSDADLEWIGD